MPLHGLEHALVLTDDLEGTKAFYCDVLGFESGERPPLAFPGYWLYLEGVACVHVAERAAYEAEVDRMGLPRAEGSVDHLAFVAGDHDAIVARLDAAGVHAVSNEMPAAGIRQLFLDDPNGVRIELNVQVARHRRGVGGGVPGLSAATELEAEMGHEDVPVLIVGGSLVGLSTAVFLGHHGVPSLVLERHRGTAIHPRAALVNQRTMETYRAVGLEEQIEEAAAREFVQNGAIVSVDSLGGKELDWYFRFINEGVEELSPSRRVFITQIGLEPVLLRAADRSGSTDRVLVGGRLGRAGRGRRDGGRPTPGRRCRSAPFVPATSSRRTARTVRSGSASASASSATAASRTASPSTSRPTSGG